MDVEMTRATVDSTTTTTRDGARDFAYSLAGQNPHAAPLDDDARGVVPMELLRVDANAFEEMKTVARARDSDEGSWRASHCLGGTVNSSLAR